MVKYELQYYNQQQLWNAYDGNRRELLRAQETIQQIPDEVTTVLDIGCGNGILTNRINREVVVGMDFANIPLRNVTKHAVCASVEKLPFKPGVFDLILITEVLEHLPEHVYVQALDEIVRLDAKYILISVPFNEDFDIDVCKCDVCETTFHPSHHCRSFDDMWYADKFPGYEACQVSYSTIMTTKNHAIARLKRQHGVYTENKLVCCPLCGGNARPPNYFLNYLFKGITLTDIILKTVLNIKRPYHQLVLMTKRQVPTE